MSKRIAGVVKPLTTLAGALILSACSVQPEPIDHEQRAERVRTDWAHMFSDQEPLMGSVSLYDAMARAVKYNLDLRLKAMESVVGHSDMHLATFDMLPEILGNAGFLYRDPQLATSSRSLDPNRLPAPPSTSQDKGRFVTDLQFTWNLLDFGVSYINAKQKADHYLITLERRRKMLHNVIRDARYAYWRAIAAQSLGHKLNPFIREIRQALRSSKEIQSAKLKSPLDALQYRKALLETLRQMTTLRRDLNHAHLELAALMNVRPGAKFTLRRERAHQPLPRNFPRSLRTLERIALLDRPELREEDYRTRISEKDIRKERLRMLPGLEINAGGNYDSNSFLVDNSWANAGARLTWNLIKIFQGPAAIKNAQFRFDVAHIRRLALSMAIMTQVDIAYLRYKQSLRELRIARQIRKLDDEIYRQTRQEYQAKKTTQLELIRAKAHVILSHLRYDLGYADWQNSAGQLLNSVGFEPLHCVTTTNQPVHTLAKEIRHSLMTVPTMNFTKFAENATENSRNMISVAKKETTTKPETTKVAKADYRTGDPYARKLASRKTNKDNLVNQRFAQANTQRYTQPQAFSNNTQSGYTTPAARPAPRPELRYSYGVPTTPAVKPTTPAVNPTTPADKPTTPAVNPTAPAVNPATDATNAARQATERAKTPVTPVAPAAVPPAMQPQGVQQQPAVPSYGNQPQSTGPAPANAKPQQQSRSNDTMARANVQDSYSGRVDGLRLSARRAKPLGSSEFSGSDLPEIL